MPARPRSTAALRRLIDAAMELERRTMHLYCVFESQFSQPEELRTFWFDMAQHESRHFGALALVAGLIDSASKRSLRAATSLTPARVAHLRRLLSRLHAEAERGVTIERAFEIALEIEGSEIEDVVLDLLQALKGEAERERAVKLLIHDLGDLGYMIEKHTSNHELLARADELLEQQVGRLRSKSNRTKRRLHAVKG
jgi:dihydroxyacetone kinase